jgi:hypothetical protein
MSDPTPFKTYFQELQTVAQPGDAREESFYPALAGMLAELRTVPISATEKEKDGERIIYLEHVPPV